MICTLRGVKWIPLKIICFALRLIREKISVSTNLLKRGILMTSTLWPFCQTVEESVDHVFFWCGETTKLWIWLLVWSCNYIVKPASCVELFDCFNLWATCNKANKMRLSGCMLCCGRYGDEKHDCVCFWRMMWSWIRSIGLRICLVLVSCIGFIGLCLLFRTSFKMVGASRSLLFCFH